MLTGETFKPKQSCKLKTKKRKLKTYLGKDMKIRLEPLEQGYFYHIFNRGINSCNVFLNDDNRLFFLAKVKQYLLPVADVYAYCLMPNHFHFIIRIKDDFSEEFAEEGTSPKFQTLAKLNKESGLHSEKSVASKQIAKLISSYTQAFNKYHNRHGSLFERPFKRKKIESELYLLKSIVYVHRNVLDLSYKMNEYQFSSYKSLISNTRTSMKRKEVIELFENVENFIFVHQIENDYEI